MWLFLHYEPLSWSRYVVPRSIFMKLPYICLVICGLAIFYLERGAYSSAEDSVDIVVEDATVVVSTE